MNNNDFNNDNIEQQNQPKNGKSIKRRIYDIVFIVLAIAIVFSLFGQFKASAYEATVSYSVYDNTDLSRTSITSDTVTFSGNWQGGFTGSDTRWYVIYRLPFEIYSGTIKLLINDQTYDTITISGSIAYTYELFDPWQNITDISTIGIQFVGPDSATTNAFEFCELIATNTSNQSEALSYVEYELSRLNTVSTDYVVSFDSYSTNDTTYTVNQTGINQGVTFSDRIYLTSNEYGTYFTINGYVAMQDGVSKYDAYVSGDVEFDPVALENLSTSDNSRWAQNYIAENSLDITNYGSKAQFHATFNLTDRVGDTVAVYITATNPHSQTETVVMCVYVYVDHSHPEETETDTETDTTDTPEDGTEDETNTPVTPPEFESPNLQDAYNKGYQQGLLDMQNGVFGDIVVNVTYYYRCTGLDTPITDTVSLSLANATNGLSFKPIYEYYTKSAYYTEQYELIEIAVQMWFPGAFQFTNNLIYFSGSDSLTLSDMPVDLQVYTLNDEQIDVEIYLTQKSKQFYWTIDGWEHYKLTEAITFRIDNKYKTFESILVDNYLAINSNNIQYTTNVSSYEKGKADGYDKGYDFGYIKGEEYGKQQENIISYSQGKQQGYEEGYKVGELVGRSDALKNGLGWYELILAIPDAHLQVFNGLFDFTLFGVNMANFVLSMITLIVLWRVKKFIL